MDNSDAPPAGGASTQPDHEDLSIKTLTDASVAAAEAVAREYRGYIADAGHAAKLALAAAESGHVIYSPETIRLFKRAVERHRVAGTKAEVVAGHYDACAEKLRLRGDALAGEILAKGELAAEPLVHLERLTEKHRVSVEYIVGLKDVWTRIGNGKPWTDVQITKFLAYSTEEWGAEGARADAKHPLRKRRVNAYHAVMVGESCVGVVGIHTAPYADLTPKNNKRAITVFLRPDVWGHGVGTEAVRQALAEWKRSAPSGGPQIALDARKNNPGAARVAEKLGARPEPRLRLPGTPKASLRFNLDLDSEIFD